MRLLIICTVILLASCSQPFVEYSKDVALSAITGSKMSRNPSACPKIKRECSGGEYKEWYQDNGKKACACNK